MFHIKEFLLMSDRVLNCINAHRLTNLWLLIELLLLDMYTFKWQGLRRLCVNKLCFALSLLLLEPGVEQLTILYVHCQGRLSAIDGSVAIIYLMDTNTPQTLKQGSH